MNRLTAKLCLFGSILLTAGIGYAQVPTMGAITPLGVATAANYGAGGFESHNLFNGYLSAAMPLHHIGGRGEAGFDLVWNLQPGWLAAYNGIPGVNAIVAIDPYPSTNNISGPFSNSYALGGPGSVFLRTGASWKACSGSGYGLNTTVTSVIFTMPNGSQVSLVDTATNGAAASVPFNSCSGGQPTSWYANRGMVFRSVDNSQIQFTASSNVNEQVPNGHGYGVATISGTLLFPNGVFYSVSNSKIIGIEDRNGNKITLTYGGPSVAIDWYLSISALTQVIDSLGRVTNINYSDSTCGGCLSITYPGAGTTQHQVQVITGLLANNFGSGSAGTSIGALFPNSGQPTSYNFNPTVASAVKLPDGTQYSFQYNSWGEVARVTLPTGGAIEYSYGCAGRPAWNRG